MIPSTALLAAEGGLPWSSTSNKYELGGELLSRISTKNFLSLWESVHRIIVAEFLKNFFSISHGFRPSLTASHNAEYSSPFGICVGMTLTSGGLSAAREMGLPARRKITDAKKNIHDVK